MLLIVKEASHRLFNSRNITYISFEQLHLILVDFKINLTRYESI